MDTAIAIIIVAWMVFWLMDLALNSRVWWWEFFSFVPGWAILLSNALALMFAVALFYYSPWLLLGVAVCTPLAFNRSDFNLYARQRRQQSMSGSAFTLFNWNTEFWDWENVDRFYEFLRTQDADIYHLQEGTKPFRMDEILTPEQLAHLQSYFPGYQIFQNGELVSLSRLPVQHVEADPTSKFLRLDIAVGGKTVSAYNVHIPVQIKLENFPNRRETLQHMRLAFRERLLQFRKLETAATGNPLAKVISGDFNTAKTISLIQPLFRRYMNSYHALRSGLPRSYVFKNKLRWWRIDWIFGEGVQFRSHTDIHPQGFSDHWGQLVEFSI